MILCFITREENTSRLIMERLHKKKIGCFLQTDWVALYRDLQDYNCKISMIACDFALAGSSYFNLAQSIREMGKSIPVVYYNDPLPKDEERVSHWISQNELNLKEGVSDEVREVFHELNLAVTDPRIRRHISILQPALPVGFDASSYKTSEKEIDLLDFRLRKKLTPVMFSLFEFMYKNRRKDLSIKEIARVLFKKKKSFFLRRNTCVYAYISRLRCLIENDLIVKIKIIRSSRGCYRMIVY